MPSKGVGFLLPLPLSLLLGHKQWAASSASCFYYRDILLHFRPRAMGDGVSWPWNETSDIVSQTRPFLLEAVFLRCLVQWQKADLLKKKMEFSRDRVSCFSLSQTWIILDHDLPTCASWVAGITNVSHHAWLVFEMGDGLTNFCLHWPQTSILLSLLPKLLGLQVWATVSSLHSYILNLCVFYLESRTLD
jgi:hypothetical protein